MVLSLVTYNFKKRDLNYKNSTKGFIRALESFSKDDKIDVYNQELNAKKYISI